MARKAQFPPKIHRHSSGQARVHWRGTDYYLGPFGTPEAQAAYLKLLAELGGPDGQPRAEPKVLTVADALALWLVEVDRTRDPAGREPYHHRLMAKAVIRLYGTLPAAEFGARHLEGLQRALADGSWAAPEDLPWYTKHRVEVKLSCGVVNHRITRLRTCWRWLERQGHVPPGTYAALKVVSKLKKRDRSVRHLPKRQPSTREQLDAVLPHVQPRLKKKPVRAMLELQWLAGMRSGEVRILRPCDIDRSGPVWLYRPHRHKTEIHDLPRVIHLGPECQRLLAPWLLGCPADWYVFRPMRNNGANKPFGAKAYARSVRDACLLAGVKLVPYGGRHAFKDRVTRQFGLDAARSCLGQMSLTIANEYGIQLDMEKASEVAAKLA